FSCNYELPGERLAEVKVASGGAVVREGCKSGAGFAAFAHFHDGIGATHVSFYPSRVRRVHLDIGVAQVISEVNGERVERGLGSVIGEGFRSVNWRLGIGLQGE